MGHFNRKRQDMKIVLKHESHVCGVRVGLRVRRNPKNGNRTKVL
jgi:hypothetical protein